MLVSEEWGSRGMGPARLTMAARQAGWRLRKDAVGRYVTL